MKHKNQKCPNCEKIMKYRGSHIFYCKKCNKIYQAENGKHTEKGKIKLKEV